MSKVIRDEAGRDLGQIVQTNDGKYYYVDSADTWDRGYETMVFSYDFEKGEVDCWTDLYCVNYNNFGNMVKLHTYICEHLEEFL